MNKIKKIFSLLLSSTVLTVSAGNIILVGDSYGKHEVKILVNRAVVEEGKTRQYEIAGTDVPLEKLKDCSLLVVATATARKLSSEEMAMLRRWVSDGGNLLLIGQATRSMGAPTDWGWAGISAVRSVRNGYPVKVSASDSPLLNGLNLKPDVELFNANMAFSAKPPMTAVLGNAEECLVGMAEVGKGRIFLLALEYFRMAGKQKHPFADEWLQIIKNVIDLANPVNDADVQKKQLSDWQKKRGGVLIWEREWQRGEIFGPRFDPPLPQESELLIAKQLHLARNEFESIQLNLTPLEAYREISWKLDGGGFPLEKLEFLVQDMPKPIPWPRKPEIAREFPYWLIPPEYLAPEGKAEFIAPAAGDTKTIWLRFNTHDVATGNYRPILTLTFDGRERVKIPFQIKVAKTAVPAKRRILLGVGGYALDVTRLKQNHRFLDNLRDHGNEWCLINIIRLSQVRFAGTGETLSSASLKKHAANQPRLDFSVLDEWIHANLERNMTNFKVNLPAVRLNTEIQKAGFSKEQQKSMEDWFYREFSAYMHEKGVRVLLTAKGDELSRDEIYSSWLPWAKELTAAGFDCTSTFSFGHGDYRQLITDLSPFVRMWTLNRSLAPMFLKRLNAGEIVIRPDALVGTYGAGEGRGSEFRKPLTASRFLGWESWKLGVENCSPNPWFKGWLYYCDYGNYGETGGIGGERWVSYIDRNDPNISPADCPFWEGIRDGMEEANLAALLETRAKTLGRVDLLEKLDTLVSDRPDAPVYGRWERKTRGKDEFDWYQVKADVEGYRRAKSEILSVLDELPPDASLFWHRINLKQVELAGIPEAIRQFKSLVKDFFGIELESQDNAPVKIHFRTAAVMKEGDYRIEEKHDNGKLVLTVNGGGATGIQLGVRMFAAFLNQHGKW